MNLTHSEPYDAFLSRYGARRLQIAPLLAQFTPNALRVWAQALGIDTFVGSSGSVFPTDMKTAPLLCAWLHRLRQAGVQFHMRHRWLGWNDSGALTFDTPQDSCSASADAVLLALGGGSWGGLARMRNGCRCWPSAMCKSPHCNRPIADLTLAGENISVVVLPATI